MSDHARDELGRKLEWLLAAVGLAGLGTFAWTSWPRIASPYPLEWMEGASLQHALMLARGELPYAAPSAEFIPYVYPPLAYVPMAMATLLFGPSLPAARAVSLLCTLGALALIGIAGARLARSRAAGVFSAGLFAFGFGYGGAFLDLARVDALFVLCCAAALERLSAGRNAAALAWLAASALAKQHGAVLLLAVSAALLVRERRAAVRPVLGAWLALLTVCGALQLASGGWFARYAIEVPGKHGLEPQLLVSFVLVDLLIYLPVLTVAAAVSLGRRARALTAIDVLALAAIAVSALGRAHPGGDDNVRLPALALLCVIGVAPICARVLLRCRLADEAGAGMGKPARIGLTLALCVQAAVLFQPPGLHAPRPEAAERFERLRSALARCAGGGPAVALDYGLFTGTPFVHTMALSDLQLGGPSDLATAGMRALLEALRGPKAPRAVAVGDRFPELERSLDERYELCADLPAPRLPTGYQPGLRTREGLRQQVFALKRP